MRPAPKASIKLGQPQGGSIPNVILERTFFVALCVVGFGEVTYAADGYRAIGFFTSTVFRASGETTHKNVIMFDVTVVEAEWRIRTEAVRPQGGIAYHEASYNSTNGIFMVTAFDSAVENSDSPLRFLRAELERTNMENLFFKNPPLISAGKSNELASEGAFRAIDKRQTNNVAIARAVKGSYPPSDGYLNFLWFAFTPPNPGPDGLLPQSWDDGFSQTIGFRRARWKQFAEPPGLIASAEYDWVGKRLHVSGLSEQMKNLGVSKPEEIASVYNVSESTNVDGFVLPKSFKLTRFAPRRGRNGEQIVMNVMDALVVNAISISSDQLLDVKVPGKTIVTDYRLAAGESKGVSPRYSIYSNSLPNKKHLEQMGILSRAADKSVAPSHVRSTLLVFLLISSVALILVWKTKSV